MHLNQKSMSQQQNISDLEERLQSLSAAEGLGLVSELFPDKVVFSTSLGQEDQVIAQLIALHSMSIRIAYNCCKYWPNRPLLVFRMMPRARSLC